MQLPAPVRAAVAEHLRRVDELRPGLIEALYVVGSVALGEYRPGVSDIDVLAVTARPPDPDDLAALGETHAAIPRYDGVYLDRATMARQPDQQEPTTFAVNGQFQVDQPCGELNPVVWLTLARYGISARGPRPEVRLHPDRLRRYNLTNLEQYWRPLAGRIHRAGAGQPADLPVDADAMVWTLLGPPRLHATLATADVIGKSAAGAYAASIFPTFAELIGRAVQRRDTGEGSFVWADAPAAADFVDAVIDDAWRRWGQVRLEAGSTEAGAVQQGALDPAAGVDPGISDQAAVAQVHAVEHRTDRSRIIQAGQADLRGAESRLSQRDAHARRGRRPPGR